jgi:hypothetical protein
MTDWTEYFLSRPSRRPRSKAASTSKRAISIFDTPEEVSKKPSAPAPSFSIFDAPEEVSKKPSAPTPSPAVPSPSKKKPSAEKMDKGKWQEFLDLFYEKGHQKVQNPNPKSKKKYPEVYFSTAMKHKPFAAQVKKQYESWLQGSLEAPKKESPQKSAPKDVPEPKAGDQFVDRSQLKPGVVVTNHGKPGYNKTWKIGEVLPDGTVRYHRLKSNGEWTKKTYPLHPKWIDNFMAGKHYEFIDDPAKGGPQKTQDSSKGVQEWSPDETLDVGDEVWFQDVDGIVSGKVTEILGDTVHLDLDPGELIIHQNFAFKKKPKDLAEADLMAAQKAKAFKKKPKAEKPPKEEPKAEKPPKEEPKVEKPQKEEPKVEKSQKEKPKAEKPQKGKHVKNVKDVKMGGTITWDQDGKTFYGTVDDKGDGSFYVQSMDEEGNPGPYYIFDQSDLDALSVQETSEEALPEIKGEKLPPKPEAPEIGDPPKKPDVKTISQPSDVKIGDQIEWELKGKTYRGEVVSFDDDGKFRAKVTYPSDSSSLGKTPSFDAKKIEDRSVRMVDSKMQEYISELNKYEEKKAKANAEYSQKVKEWEKKKEALQSGASLAEHPAKSKQFKNFSAPSHWNPNSSIGRKADRLLKEFKEKHGKKISSLAQEVMNADPGPNPSGYTWNAYFGNAKTEWDSFTPGQRALWKLSTDEKLSQDVGGWFTNNILDSAERSAWKSALAGWQSSSKSEGAHRLMGAAEEIGLKGAPKEWEVDSASCKNGRKNGRKNKALKSAVAKAMAFSQAFYDALGVKDVILYRGTRNKAATYADTGSPSEMPNARELTSFSVNPETAYSFNNRAIKYKIPVQNLFISPVTLASLGPNPPHAEAEFIVADLADLEGVILPKYATQIDDYADKIKIASQKRTLVFFEGEEDDDWFQRAQRTRKEQKDMDKTKKTAHRLLRLASDNREFRAALLTEMRRMNAPRDFAVDQESKQAMLTRLRPGDVLKIHYLVKEGEPSLSATYPVLFDFDASTGGVELASEGDRRAMLIDRGGEEGVVYEPGSGPAYPVLKMSIVRSRV